MQIADYNFGIEAFYALTGMPPATRLQYEILWHLTLIRTCTFDFAYMVKLQEVPLLSNKDNIS